MKKKIFTVESRYGEVTKFNSNFHKVKIYVAYAGLNRNGSIITKETFETMIPSLYGVPIIGEHYDGEFHGHGGELVINDEGANYYDTTKAFGYIDSSANVRWENVTEGDGSVREYLTVDGFLWSGKYPECLSALDGSHNQSMELVIQEGDYSEESDAFEITGAEFLALCILSPDTEPCFESARVSQFGLQKEEFKSDFATMVKELKFSLNDDLEKVIKGGENVGEEKNKSDDAVELTDLEKATKAVDKAEESKLQADIDIAKELVSKLEDGEDKEGLSERLEVGVSVEDPDNKEADQGLEQPVIKEPIVEDGIEQPAIEEPVVEDGISTDAPTDDYKAKYEALLVQFSDVSDKLVEVDTKFDTVIAETESLRIFKSEKDAEAVELENAKVREEKTEYIESTYGAELSDEMLKLFISRVDNYDTEADIDADICVYMIKNKVAFSRKKGSTERLKFGMSDKVVKSKSDDPYGDIFKKKEEQK